jgi:hypothetical protein
VAGKRAELMTLLSFPAFQGLHLQKKKPISKTPFWFSKLKSGRKVYLKICLLHEGLKSRADLEVIRGAEELYVCETREEDLTYSYWNAWTKMQNDKYARLFFTEHHTSLGINHVYQLRALLLPYNIVKPS